MNAQDNWKTYYHGMMSSVRVGFDLVASSYREDMIGCRREAALERALEAERRKVATLAERVAELQNTEEYNPYLLGGEELERAVSKIIAGAQ